MTTPKTLRLLGGIGALSVLVGQAAAQVDTSQWKCETCPFEKGMSGSADVGAGIVFGRTARFGDFTGLDRHKVHAVLGGSLRWRGDSGLYARASAAELGLDSRELAAVFGREGLFALTLRYDETPRRLADGARTPFVGVGSGTLTLPPGFPAPTTSAMPLAATLRPLDLGYERERLDVGATIYGGANVEVRLAARRDVREGTIGGAGSHFATAAQLPLPLDQTTDQFDVAAGYARGGLQVAVGYHASRFRNGQESLTWANPFTPVVAGATRGTLALAPDNEFHQFTASAGYDLGARVRASADVAVGRMTQDSPYVAATTNPTLVTIAVPTRSLNGRVETLNATLRVQAALTEQLRAAASLSHDERDNETPVATYPGIAADVFVTPPAANRPYGFTQDRLRLSADYRATGLFKGSAGVDVDRTERTLQEVGRTEDAKVWLRVAAQPLAALALSARAAHAERRPSEIRAAGAFAADENPLLRRYHLAHRLRDTGGVRADYAAAENVGVGVEVDFAYDDYHRSTLGLLSGRSVGGGVDVTAALGDATSITAYAHAERARTRQSGSQRFGLPDWHGDSRDEFDIAGVGVRHAMLGGRLDIAADLVAARGSNRLDVDPGSSTPAFACARTERTSLRLQAAYKLQKNVALVASWWYERYDTRDWKLDGVLPDAVANLLAFGTVAPGWHAQVWRVYARIGF